MNDIDMLCGSLEFVCDGVGGFVVGKYSLIDKQRLFGASPDKQMQQMQQLPS